MSSFPHFMNFTWLVFGGLLFFALSRRALANRVAELEAVLQSRQ